MRSNKRFRKNSVHICPHFTVFFCCIYNNFIFRKNKRITENSVRSAARDNITNLLLKVKDEKTPFRTGTVLYPVFYVETDRLKHAVDQKIASKKIKKK
jgi:hypothetical protein